MSCHALLNNIQYHVQIWILSQGLLSTEKTIKNTLLIWQAWNTWTPTTYKAQPWIFTSSSSFWEFLIAFLGPAVLNATFLIIKPMKSALHQRVAEEESSTPLQDIVLFKSKFQTRSLNTEHMHLFTATEIAVLGKLFLKTDYQYLA